MTQFATICKQFTFHAAHRLYHHEGACSRQHGHSYKLEVMLTGKVRGPDGNPDEGMVADFGIVKDIYTNQVEPYVEHQDLNETLRGFVPETEVDLPHDPELKDITEEVLGHPREIPKEPLTTCENLAAWIYSKFAERLDNGDFPQRRVSVRLWETPTSWAEVGPTPWRAVD